MLEAGIQYSNVPPLPPPPPSGTFTWQVKTNSHIPQARGQTRGQACRFHCQQLIVCIPDSHTFTQLTCAGVTVMVCSTEIWPVAHAAGRQGLH